MFGPAWGTSIGFGVVGFALLALTRRGNLRFAVKAWAVCLLVFSGLSAAFALNQMNLNHMAATTSPLTAKQQAMPDLETLQRENQRRREMKQMPKPPSRMFSGNSAPVAQSPAMIRYLEYVQQHIWKHWLPPRGFDNKSLQCAVLFSINVDGTSSDVRVAHSSGDSRFDEISISTIKKCEPFPTSPAVSKPISIEFNFAN